MEKEQLKEFKEEELGKKELKAEEWEVGIKRGSNGRIEENVIAGGGIQGEIKKKEFKKEFKK